MSREGGRLVSLLSGRIIVFTLAAVVMCVCVAASISAFNTDARPKNNKDRNEEANAQPEDANAQPSEALTPMADQYDPDHHKKHHSGGGGSGGDPVTFEIGDAQNESGDIETENEFAIEGNNNSACLGQLQFDNSGNFTNQQGALQYVSEGDDFEFAGPESEFAPENGTECEQGVEQASTASSIRR